MWARWVVDGVFGYEIDSREMPADWSTGYLPLRKKTPYEQPVDALEGQVFELNAGLRSGLQPDARDAACRQGSSEGDSAVTLMELRRNGHPL